MRSIEPADEVTYSALQGGSRRWLRRGRRPLWGEPAIAALAALNVEGRLIQIGNSAGESIDLPTRGFRKPAGPSSATPTSRPGALEHGALAEVLGAALREGGVAVEEIRLADHSFPHGVETEMGEGDEWPGDPTPSCSNRRSLVFATPTWIGRHFEQSPRRPSSG